MSFDKLTTYIGLIALVGALLYFPIKPFISNRVQLVYLGVFLLFGAGFFFFENLSDKSLIGYQFICSHMTGYCEEHYLHKNNADVIENSFLITSISDARIEERTKLRRYLIPHKESVFLIIENGRQLVLCKDEEKVALQLTKFRKFLSNPKSQDYVLTRDYRGDYWAALILLLLGAGLLFGAFKLKH